MNVRYFYQLLAQKQIPVITDTSELYRHFSSRSYEVVLFENYDFTQNRVVLAVISGYDCYTQLLDRANSSLSTVVHLAAVRYDESLEAIFYAFDRMLECKIEKILERREQIYDEIANSSEGLHLIDARGSNLKCCLSEILEVVNNEDTLREGYFYSISEFLEASIVNIQGNKSSFSLDGTFFFDGTIHASTLQSTKLRNKEALCHLSEAVTLGRTKYLEIKDNSIHRLIVDDRDRTNLLLNLDLDSERKLSITEMGFGCDPTLIDNVDWTINSIINRVIPGMHLGVGTAYHCPYVNFVSQTIKIVEN